MKPLITFVAVLIAFSSCTSRVYLSPSTLKEFRESGIDPKKLQYYNDYSFSWQTKSTLSNAGVKDGGMLQSSQSVNYKKTSIAGETECTIADVNTAYVDMNFEVGAPPIRFWYFDSIKGFAIQNDVQYGGAVYKRDYKNPTPVKIFVKSKDLKSVSYQKHKMKGVKVQ